MVKRVALTCAGLLALGLLGGCAGKPAGPRQTTLRAADVHPDGYPTTEGLRFMADVLEDTSDGRITMEIFPGGTMGGEKQTIEQTKVGTLDINRTSTSPLAEFVPELGVYSLPYLFRDSEHMWQVLEGPIGRELLEALEPHGFVGLCYYDSGARSFYNSKRPIQTPADLKGLKIRVQKSRVMQASVAALGASPTSMAFGEVYPALRQGVIDGAENNPPSYQNTKHYEAAKYYSLDEHTRIPEVVICSKTTWDTLSEPDRALLREAAEASAAEQRKLWQEYEEKSMAALRTAGVEVNRPDPAPFRQAAQSVYREYEEQYGDLVRRISEAK